MSSTLFPLRRTLPLAAAAALTAVALTACGSSGPTAAATSTAAATPVAGASTAASVSAHNAADVTFAQSMIPHHRQAVQMAELADTRAASPAVTRLAAAIRAAQDPEIQTMTGWLTSWGEPTTATATATMPGMTGGSGMGSTGMMSDADMAMLTALSGPAFDRAFLTMMTAHHRGAIEMARTEQSQGRYPAAEKLAAGIVAAQTAEIAQMTGLLARV